MAEPVDGDLLDVLIQRDGIETEVVLRDGQHLSVFNIAWGYDDGDVNAHVTTNISPSFVGSCIDFFWTNDVMSILEPRTGAVVYGPGARRV